MHLYTSRRRCGKSSRRRRQRQSTRKSYTCRAKRSKRPKRVKRTKRSRNKMSGGGNGLAQVLTNTYRFTIDTGLNMYNGFKGNNRVNLSNVTLGQFA